MAAAGDATAGVLDEWITWLRAAGRPETTIRLRRAQLRRLERDFPALECVTTGQLVSWLGRPGWSAETRRSHRAAVVGFYRWALLAGHVDADPAAGLPQVAPGQHGARPAPDDVIRRALLRSDDRLRLMLVLMSRHGLRRGEVARVHTSDLIRDLAGWSLLVHGKGSRDRVIPLGDDAAQAIRQRPAGWVFPGQIDGHLSPARVGELVSESMPRPWTAHTLRHRFATVAYAGSRDLIAVQQLLGHVKPETTLCYVRPPDDALRAAAAWAA